MVTIIGYKECISQNSKMFYSLILQGDITVSKSENGNLYFTANKTSIMTSFDENYCMSLVGKQIPGIIKKVPCEEYEYINTSGEVVLLKYRYVYSPKEEAVEKQEKIEGQKQQQTQIPFATPNMESIRAVA